MQVRITRKFAELIDGIDLSRRRVGDVIALSDVDAAILIREGWAIPADRPPERRATHQRLAATASDTPRRSRQRRR